MLLVISLVKATFHWLIILNCYYKNIRLYVDNCTETQVGLYLCEIDGAEYPLIGDQLDALWKLIKANADKIDLAEAAPLLEAVQAVKDKYQKPL